MIARIARIARGAVLVHLLLLSFPAGPGRAPAFIPPAACAAGTDVAQIDQPSYGTDSAIEAERRKARSRFRYLMLGYGLIWVSLGVYLFQLNRNIARVGQEVDELKGRLDEAEGRSRRREI